MAGTGNALNAIRATNFFLGTAGNFTLSGARNWGAGIDTLQNLTTGSDNVNAGFEAGDNFTTASRCVTIGSLAHADGTSSTDCVSIGYSANTLLLTGSFVISIGSQAGSAYTGSESSNILIGHPGILGESNICRIGVEGSGSGEITDMYLAGTVHTTQIATAGITGTSTLSFARSSTGASYTNTFSNTDNTDPASALVLQLTTGGASGGDPYILFQTTGVTSWIVGIDNSDSDKWKVSNSTAPGTNDYLVISTDPTITLNAGQVVKTRTVTGASDTQAASDCVLFCNRSGAIALSLMASPETGRVVEIKDTSGAASLNNITITPAAGNIDESATYVINTNYGGVKLIYNGTSWSVMYG